MNVQTPALHVLRIWTCGIRQLKCPGASIWENTSEAPHVLRKSGCKSGDVITHLLLDLKTGCCSKRKAGKLQPGSSGSQPRQSKQAGCRSDAFAAPGLDESIAAALPSRLI
mmetsp:Transcript_16930/g.36688  ORF Transcript_16930/g.36688 Transcript_16930/m.36688 type:complete len:111 (-) Transcript_16930:196-528(-)